ncbi:glycoside hydrolase family 88 protein [Alteromonadaceae bacterium BrNp21-10]|nr:glycoside hydrolase family 88 protein [Alteromonadaceae bacterium BrNp21-10]
MDCRNYIVLLFMVLSCFENAVAVAAQPSEVTAHSVKSPEVIAQMIVDDLLKHDEFMLYISDHFTGIHYAEAVLGYAALDFAHQRNKPQLLQQLLQRFEQVPDVDKLVFAEHVDANVYGVVPLQHYLISGDKQALKQGLELADAQWQQPLANGMSQQTRYWIDDIYMVNILQVQAYRATGNPIYLDRAALQTANYLNKLQQANGLFFHGENAHFYWGRGNGWVAAGIAELLAELPSNHVYYPQVLAGYQKMMAALLGFQADDGMWRQLVNEPKAWKETSATAMFGYAMLVGVSKGILTGPEYTKAYQKAWAALMTYVDPQGLLTDVCVGTGQSQDINYYLQRPKITGDFHGQAPLLWFANGLLALEP